MTQPTQVRAADRQAFQTRYARLAPWQPRRTLNIHSS